MSNKKEPNFIYYLSEQRRIFVSTVKRTTSVSEDLELRTEIDSLLIAYDQAVEKIKKYREDYGDI